MSTRTAHTVRSASSRASTASSGCIATGELAALAVESFGAGAQVVCGRDGAVAGARSGATAGACGCWSRARASTGSSAWSTRSSAPPADRRACKCSTGSHTLMTGLHSGFNVFSYLTFRAILATVSALAISLLVGPRMIAQPVALSDRPGRARRRPQDASAQGRHADDGRHADPGHDARQHAAVGRALPTASSGRCSGVTFAFGLIGFYDDYLKLVVRNSEGTGRRAGSISGSPWPGWRRPRCSTSRRPAPPRRRCSCRS